MYFFSPQNLYVTFIAYFVCILCGVGKENKNKVRDIEDLIKKRINKKCDIKHSAKMRAGERN